MPSEASRNAQAVGAAVVGRRRGSGSHKQKLLVFQPYHFTASTEGGNLTVHYRVYFFVMALAGAMLFFCHTGRASALGVGESAPAFALPATTAERVALADYRGDKHVVLFFYIAAFGQA